MNLSSLHVIHVRRQLQPTFALSVFMIKSRKERLFVIDASDITNVEKICFCLYVNSPRSGECGYAGEDD